MVVASTCRLRCLSCASMENRLEIARLDGYRKVLRVLRRMEEGPSKASAGRSNVTVAVRARPLNSREHRAGASTCISMSGGVAVAECQPLARELPRPLDRPRHPNHPLAHRRDDIHVHPAQPEQAGAQAEREG